MNLIIALVLLTNIVSNIDALDKKGLDILAVGDFGRVYDLT